MWTIFDILEEIRNRKKQEEKDFIKSCDYVRAKYKIKDSDIVSYFDRFDILKFKSRKQLKKKYSELREEYWKVKKDYVKLKERMLDDVADLNNIDYDLNEGYSDKIDVEKLVKKAKILKVKLAANQKKMDENIKENLICLSIKMDKIFTVKRFKFYDESDYSDKLINLINKDSNMNVSESADNINESDGVDKMDDKDYEFFGDSERPLTEQEEKNELIFKYLAATNQKYSDYEDKDELFEKALNWQQNPYQNEENDWVEDYFAHPYEDESDYDDYINPFVNGNNGVDNSVVDDDNKSDDYIDSFESGNDGVDSPVADDANKSDDYIDPFESGNDVVNNPVVDDDKKEHISKDSVNIKVEDEQTIENVDNQTLSQTLNSINKMAASMTATAEMMAQTTVSIGNVIAQAIEGQQKILEAMIEQNKMHEQRNAEIINQLLEITTTNQNIIQQQMNATSYIQKLSDEVCNIKSYVFNNQNPINEEETRSSLKVYK